MGYMKKQMEMELLSPAGSYECFEAVLGAGADAVYVGGAAFGARAYAKNFGEEELLRAIDTAHLHGKKLYLTVNTLLKNRELEEELYHYLLPYYKAGLDAVLVQDLGVLRFIRRSFPDLPIHASTQMTVTGPKGMKFLEKEGLTRVVGARELSLKELKAMHEESPLEIEAFVHGALCYSYSGQCLMSSIFGGRSGNRGRCAQPCRLPYQTAREKGGFSGKKELSPLSLKDICTIDELPELMEAGVMSLKIEGRMKQPRYAAGVTAIYRKYLDLLLEEGPDNYRVLEQDRRMLLELFSRGGSCGGYLKQHNGPNMMAFENEKKTGESSCELTTLKKKVRGILTLYPGMPAVLTLESGGTSVTVMEGEVQTAQNQPMDAERIRRQMEKLGNTEFVWEDLTIDLDPGIFVPVRVLNELRRTAFEQLREELLRPYRREDPAEHKPSENPVSAAGSENCGKAALRTDRTSDGVRGAQIPLYVSCETLEQARSAMNIPEVKGLYLPYSVMTECMNSGCAQQKELYLALPHLVRGEVPAGYMEQAQKWLSMGMKGFLVRCLESFAHMAELHLESVCVIDASLYTWNQEAVAFFSEKGVLRNTAPLELNEKELAHRVNQNSELILYGYLPLMISAQCVRKNIYGCDRKESCARLKDRFGNEFTSMCYCSPWKTETTKGAVPCYNIIYNSLPYGLLKDVQAVEKLGFGSYRLSFTVEDSRETEHILRAFTDAYRNRGKADAAFVHKLPEMTRGHFRRGAE